LKKIGRRNVIGSIRLAEKQVLFDPRKKLATSAAYDVVKRLLKRNPAVFAWAMGEPLLHHAYAQAEAIRKSNRNNL